MGVQQRHLRIAGCSKLNNLQQIPAHRWVEEKMKETTEKTDRPVLQLPKLTSQELLERDRRRYPQKAVLSSRTLEEFEKDLENLVRIPLFEVEGIESEWVEALIIAMGSGECPVKEMEKVITWYADIRGGFRSDQEIIRAFRFLLDQELSFLADDPINNMVKIAPWLYWCSGLYQERISNQLQHFLTVHSSAPYNEHDWHVLERAIRRIVAAGDWSRLYLISRISNLHCATDPEMKLVESEQKDFAAPDIHRAFLKAATRRLLEQKARDQAADVQEFGKLLGQVVVELEYQQGLLFIQSGDSVPFPFRVRLRRADGQEFSVSAGGVQLSVGFEVNGGYFPACKDRIWKEKVSTGDTFHLTLTPHLFEGRHRLELRLSLRIVGACEPKTVIVPIFVEVKKARPSEDPLDPPVCFGAKRLCCPECGHEVVADGMGLKCLNCGEYFDPEGSRI